MLKTRPNQRRGKNIEGTTHSEQGLESRLQPVTCTNFRAVDISSIHLGRIQNCLSLNPL